MPVFEGLGKALRWLREKQGKRQYEVAEDAKVTKAMLSAYETGKQRPSLDTLEKILDALGADLLTLSDALDHVNERPRSGPAPDEEGAAGAGAGAVGGPPGVSVDPGALLGLGGLPPEEEEALGQMLEDFHRFLRYLHRMRSSGSPP